MVTLTIERIQHLPLASRTSAEFMRNFFSSIHQSLVGCHLSVIYFPLQIWLLIQTVVQAICHIGSQSSRLTWEIKVTWLMTTSAFRVRNTSDCIHHGLSRHTNPALFLAKNLAEKKCIVRRLRGGRFWSCICRVDLATGPLLSTYRFGVMEWGVPNNLFSRHRRLDQDGLTLRYNKADRRVL